MTQATPIKDLPIKQQQLIDTARGLFREHGIRRVTVEEICTRAGISKMTFYKYFKNKWDMGNVVLSALFNEVTALYEQILAEEVPFAEKVEKLLSLNRDRVNAIGAAFIDDLTNPESPLFGSFMAQQKTSMELSVKFFVDAQQEGHIRQDISMPFLLFILNKMYELLNHSDFVKIIPNVEDRIHELSLFFFHGFAKTEAR